MPVKMDKASIISKYRPDLAPIEEVCRDIHRNYSFLDKYRTASVAASHLAGLDNFEVQRGVGGHGVAGALRNGPGSTFLLRADMDALPHLENTSRNMQGPRSRKITKGTKRPSCMPVAMTCTQLALWQQRRFFMRQKLRGKGP